MYIYIYIYREREREMFKSDRSRLRPSLRVPGDALADLQRELGAGLTKDNRMIMLYWVTVC